MTKKTTVTVTPAPAAKLASVITNAIGADIAANLGANKSGAEVAGVFDKQFPFPWARFKGNASAANCGMSADEFKLVRDVRTEYRDAWNAAGLPNFDRRWQYVSSLSKHAPEAEESEAEESESDAASAKTKAEQCIAALQNALRYATHEEFEGDIKTAEKIREALKLNGWTEAE